MVTQSDDFEGWDWLLEQVGAIGLPSTSAPRSAPPSRGDRGFAAARVRAIRSLTFCRRDLAGIAAADRAAKAILAIAHQTSIEISRAALAAIERASKPSLDPSSGLPSADAGPNLTARILPAPRVPPGGD